MAYIKRIIILLFAVHWIEIVAPKPLFTEVNFKKTYELFKHHGHHHPIRAHFFKEKSFGIKHTVLKRSTDSVRNSKYESFQIPVGEDEEDLSRLPTGEEAEEDQKPFASELVPVPVPAPPLPPATVIITPPPKVKPVVPLLHTVASIGPLQEIIEPVEEELLEPIEKTPLIGEKVVPLPLSGNGLEIEKPKEDVPLLPPLPPPPVDKVVEKVVESPVGRGSRLALFFGDLILQVLSQFLANAHTTLSKFLENPPQF